MHEVDKFVLFDNAQMSKRSWITRNRFSPSKGDRPLHNSDGRSIFLSLPIVKRPRSSLLLEQEHAADEFYIHKTIKKLNSWYPSANDSFRELTLNIFSILNETKVLVDFLDMQLKLLSRFFQISQPEIIRSSDVLERVSTSDFVIHDNAQDYIIKVCKKLGATTYVNLPNGRMLYDQTKFLAEDISLKFVDFNQPMELTPLLSSLHYASFREPPGMDLINQFWSIYNG